MNKKMLFVFNPHSGKGQLKNSLFDIIDIFTKGGYEVTVHPTQEKNDAFRVIRAEASGFDVVVVSGGDGTLNEAVRGVMSFPQEERPPIGYIPSGTTNDFASSRGIPKEPVKAAEKIVNGTAVPGDIGMLNGNPFCYVAAFGAFTDVPYDTPQGAKNVLGQAAYLMEGIKRLPNIESIHIRLESEEADIDDYFCVGCVLNSTSMAGISFDGKYGVELDDGLFEAALVKMPVSLIQAQELVWTVIKGEEDTEKFRLIRSSEFVLDFDEEVKWTLDGEYGGAYRHAEIKVENKAVSFIL
ncbi:MAG: YegS/Rv2252/BmrU family lipid kinase [Clostridia bacterium]|nr:YegS/Rv2252/BmrU family lipid kinase [Clostridia bacterium]